MKISVVIPAYNAQNTIARAIQSVLNQIRPADEMIVIDDGSSDNTAQAAGSFGEKVTVIRQTNAGASVARNKGIEASHGEWIAFLDADDEWLPEKLQLQVGHLREHPELKWTYSNFFRKEPDDRPLQLAHVSDKLQEQLTNNIFHDYFRAYADGGYAWTSVLIIHREVFKQTGMFEVGMKRAQDNDLWFRIGYQYPQVGYLPQPLAIYHLDTPGSSTKINDQVDFMISLVQRHEELSKKYERYPEFRPCLTLMLQVWIRKLLDQHRGKDALILLNRFSGYLSHRFRREIRFRIFIPILGPVIADAVLSFKKRLKHN